MNTQRVEGHTPTPWEAVEQKSRQGESLGWIINHNNGRIGWSSYATAVPNKGEEAPYPISAANAAFIVHACNNIERLEKVNEALATALRKTSAELLELTTGEGCDHSVGICWCDTFRALDEAKEALALAKEPA